VRPHRGRNRSLFGDVPVRVRRLLACSCHVEDEAKSFSVLPPGF
jgi:hypothetical protein